MKLALFMNARLCVGGPKEKSGLVFSWSCLAGVSDDDDSGRGGGGSASRRRGEPECGGGGDGPEEQGGAPRGPDHRPLTPPRAAAPLAEGRGSIRFAAADVGRGPPEAAPRPTSGSGGEASSVRCAGPGWAARAARLRACVVRSLGGRRGRRGFEHAAPKFMPREERLVTRACATWLCARAAVMPQGLWVAPEGHTARSAGWVNRRKATPVLRSIRLGDSCMQSRGRNQIAATAKVLENGVEDDRAGRRPGLAVEGPEQSKSRSGSMRCLGWTCLGYGALVRCLGWTCLGYGTLVRCLRWTCANYGCSRLRVLSRRRHCQEPLQAACGRRCRRHCEVGSDCRRRLDDNEGFGGLGITGRSACWHRGV